MATAAVGRPEGGEAGSEAVSGGWGRGCCSGGEIWEGKCSVSSRRAELKILEMMVVLGAAGPQLPPLYFTFYFAQSWNKRPGLHSSGLFLSGHFIIRIIGYVWWSQWWELLGASGCCVVLLVSCCIYYDTPYCQSMTEIKLPPHSELDEFDSHNETTDLISYQILL